MIPLMFVLVIALTVLAKLKMPKFTEGVQLVLVAEIVLVFVYAGLIAANILTAWLFFNKSYAMLQDAGWTSSPYLLNIAAAFLALGVYSISAVIFSACLKLQSWNSFAWMALAYSGINIVLFFVSLMAQNNISNPYTGDFNYKFYRNTDSKCVERFPKEYDYHPGHVGVKLQDPDDAIVQEWRKNPCPDAGDQKKKEQEQQKSDEQKKKDAAALQEQKDQRAATLKQAAAEKITWNYDAGGESFTVDKKWVSVTRHDYNNTFTSTIDGKFSYNYWIVNLGRGSKLTSVGIAMGCFPGYSCEIPYLADYDDKRCAPSYLSDQDGNTYKITADSVGLSNPTNWWNKMWDESDQHQSNSYRDLQEGEVVKRDLEFEPVKYRPAQQLTLHMPCLGTGTESTATYFTPKPPDPIDPVKELTDGSGTLLFVAVADDSVTLPDEDLSISYSVKEVRYYQNITIVRLKTDCQEPYCVLKRLDGTAPSCHSSYLSDEDGNNYKIVRDNLNVSDDGHGKLVYPMNNNYTNTRSLIARFVPLGKKLSLNMPCVASTPLDIKFTGAKGE